MHSLNFFVSLALFSYVSSNKLQIHRSKDKGLKAIKNEKETGKSDLHIKTKVAIAAKRPKQSALNKLIANAEKQKKQAYPSPATATETYTYGQIVEYENTNCTGSVLGTS